MRCSGLSFLPGYRPENLVGRRKPSLQAIHWQATMGTHLQPDDDARYRRCGRALYLFAVNPIEAGPPS